MAPSDSSSSLALHPDAPTCPGGRARLMDGLPTIGSAPIKRPPGARAPGAPLCPAALIKRPSHFGAELGARRPSHRCAPKLADLDARRAATWPPGRNLEPPGGPGAELRPNRLGPNQNTRRHHAGRPSDRLGAPAGHSWPGRDPV